MINHAGATCGATIGDLVLEAGVPDGVLTVIQGYDDTGAARSPTCPTLERWSEQGSGNDSFACGRVPSQNRRN